MTSRLAVEQRSVKWLRVFSACGPLLPSVISLLFPPLAIPLFTPRQVVDDHDIFPFTLAIWAPPSSFPELLSRINQTAFLWILPATTLQYYWLWIFTASLRTSVGHLLTRSIGWAFPRFFSHWALYETCGGYGPSISIYIFIFGCPDILKTSLKHLYLYGDIIPPVAVSALLCWLDNAPWTYGLAAVGAGAIGLSLWSLRTLTRRAMEHPMILESQKHTSPPKLRNIIGSAVLALLVLSLPYRVHDQLASNRDITMPPSPSPPFPLMEILILSFPRPNVTASTSIIEKTISSYLPYITNNVTLSVFTHATNHLAFDNVRALFSSSVTFYVDTDSHPEFRTGQYLHLAEAFRWVTTRPQTAEWIMLVEDDFPLCGGDKGWNALQRVMRILEARPADKQLPDRQGGFVGTGGSGLIIHRTMLPVLILLLSAHAEIVSKLPPSSLPRPADLVIQDCLLGVDPLCARRQEGGGLVITSRLIMDHIGGMVTTNPNKALNDDKWRCGWRHPFHGHKNVQVVLV